jgi:hypothetical protein
MRIPQPFEFVVTKTIDAAMEYYVIDQFKFENTNMNFITHDESNIIF